MKAKKVFEGYTLKGPDEEQVKNAFKNVQTIEQLSYLIQNAPGNWFEYEINPDVMSEKHTWDLEYGDANVSDGYAVDFYEGSLQDIMENFGKFTNEMFNMIDERTHDWTDVHTLVLETDDGAEIAFFDLVPKKYRNTPFPPNQWDHKLAILFNIFKESDPDRIKWKIRELEKGIRFFKKLGVNIDDN